jgi:hypothetical protein
MRTQRGLERGLGVVILPLGARAQSPDKTPEGRNIAFELQYYGDDVGAIASRVSDLLRANVDITSWPRARQQCAPRKQRHNRFRSS